jgi:DNA-binding transcriptional LysR family regulator
MTDLSNNQLRRLDLTLLLVFLGLIRRRKAIDVANELGLTQSAISQALKRLREVFADDLFLRRPHGMEPTAVALALEAPIASAVEALRGALGGARQFDPEVATGIVRIAAFDAEQAVIVPALSARLQLRAPGLRLSVMPFGRTAAVDALSDGRVDLALGYLWDMPDAISSAKLYEEGYLVAGSAKNIPRAPRLSLSAYCACDHVIVSPAGDLRGVVDARLEALGRSRRIMLGLPSFLPALAAAAASDALVTLPSRIAATFAKGFGLVTAKPPLEIRSFDVSIYWHKRNERDTELVWIRDQLYDIYRSAKLPPLRRANRVRTNRVR